MEQVIVMKFGGSSIASAAAIEWIGEIVRSHLAEQPVVVVSAMGKTTDRLVEAMRYAEQGSSYSAWRRLEDLRLYHFHETQRLLGPSAREFLERRIAPDFHKLHATLVELAEGRKLTPQIEDEILSYGERFSSEIVAAAFRLAGMKTRHIDSREVIKTDDQFTCAAPLCWETYANLRRTVSVLGRDHVVVMGGFIGATRDGETTTLGRGGSDLTASLVGTGIAAREIQIWTDVDGMLTSDPRVLHGGYRLRSLAYDEAEELARMGAKVLCPRSVSPAVRQGIPIVIRNSRHPEIEGTRIGPDAIRKPGVVKAIACKTGMTVVHLFVQEAGMLPVISSALSDLFERHGVNVEMVQAQTAGVSFAVESSPHLGELLRGIDPSVRIAVEENSAIVSLIGEGITSNPSTQKRALTALLKDTGIQMVSQGGSQKSSSFAVPESKLTVSVENLHREFFRAADPEIFAPTPESDLRRPLTVTAERAQTPGRGWELQPGVLRF
jgi:aspartate kinase